MRKTAAGPRPAELWGERSSIWWRLGCFERVSRLVRRERSQRQVEAFFCNDIICGVKSNTQRGGCVAIRCHRERPKGARRSQWCNCFRNKRLPRRCTPRKDSLWSLCDIHDYDTASRYVLGGDQDSADSQRTQLFISGWGNNHLPFVTLIR